MASAGMYLAWLSTWRCLLEVWGHPAGHSFLLVVPTKTAWLAAARLTKLVTKTSTLHTTLSSPYSIARPW